VHHPSKVADTPCSRCGTFICEWCVKLAPDWAAGQCVDCQRVVQPSGTAASKLGRAQSFAFIISMGWTVLGLARGIAADAAELPSAGAVVAVGVQGLLVVGSAACLLSVLLRRVEAPMLVRVVMGVFAAFDLLVFAFEPAGAGSVGRLVVNLVISLSWIAWFTLSPDVPRLFVNGAHRKP
jgi:hypothetical protein